MRALGIGAAAASVAVAVASRSRRVQRWDDALERSAAPRRARVRRIAQLATLPGERFGHPAIGAAVAFTIFSRRDGRRRRVVVPLAAASLGAIAAHYGIKFFYRRPRPRIALRRGKTEPAYPSGHAADATAVLFTGAYLAGTRGAARPCGRAADCRRVGARHRLVTRGARVALGVGCGWRVAGGRGGGGGVRRLVRAIAGHRGARSRERSATRAVS